MGDFMNAINLNNIVNDSLTNSSNNNKIGEKIVLIKHHDNSFLLNCFNIIKKDDEDINQKLQCSKTIEKEYSWIDTISKFLENYLLNENLDIKNISQTNQSIIIDINNIERKNISITIEIQDNNTDELNELYRFVKFLKSISEPKKSIPNTLRQMSKENLLEILSECDIETLIKMLLGNYNSKTLFNIIKNKQRIK